MKFKSELSLNCWEENVSLLKQLAKDEGIECEYKKLYTDCDGDTLFRFTFKSMPNNKTLDYYQKNRRKK
jgi:hypothetical protein